MYEVLQVETGGLEGVTFPASAERIPVSTYPPYCIESLRIYRQIFSNLVIFQSLPSSKNFSIKGVK
jgi:hypothetical protein